MKKEFSTLELHYLIEELKPLEGSKIESIYQPEKEEIVLLLYKAGEGKKFLRLAGKFAYIAGSKQESPQTPFGFCSYLRKKIGSARLEKIEQISSERIISIGLITKDKNYALIIELFGSGNIILTEKNVILSALENQKFKDREIRPGIGYAYPKREHNLFEIGKDGLLELITESKQESIVKTLAIELGLGGIYSEELCLLSKISKSAKPGEIKKEDSDRLHKNLIGMLNRKPSPTIVYDGEDTSNVIDITPFELETYKDFRKEPKETFSNALDSVLSKHIIREKKQIHDKARSKEVERARKSIEAQENSIKKLTKTADESQKKGEMIYENYKLIQEILDELNKARQKYSFKEIKEKLKGHKIIKEVDEKEKTITIELG